MTAIFNTPSVNEMPPNTHPDAVAERGDTTKQILDKLNERMSARTELDFGAFPGVSNISLDITGQTNIVATSVVECFVVARATDDHTTDEHVTDAPRVYADNITPGVGFTIYGVHRGNGDTLTYGKWSVGWRWN